MTRKNGGKFEGEDWQTWTLDEEGFERSREKVTREGRKEIAHEGGKRSHSRTCEDRKLVKMTAIAFHHL